MGKWDLLERSALEYRMPDNNLLRTLRLRNCLALQYAASSKLDLSLYEELFCNIAAVSTSHFFDHNRVGLTFTIISLCHEFSLALKDLTIPAYCY